MHKLSNDWVSYISQIGHQLSTAARNYLGPRRYKALMETIPSVPQLPCGLRSLGCDCIKKNNLQNWFYSSLLHQFLFRKQVTEITLNKPLKQ